MLLLFPGAASLAVVAGVALASRCAEPLSHWLVHEYIAAVMHGSILVGVGGVFFTRERLAREDQLFAFIMWPARLVAACVFFAGLAKLNRDFLNARISCGGVYYLWIREWPGLSILPTSEAAKQYVIYSTVVLELAGPILLWPKATRAVGIAMLWLLALGLSANTRAIYFEFIGLFWACSLCWLRADTWQAIAAGYERNVAFGPPKYRVPLKLALGAAIVVMVAQGHGAHDRTPLIFVWLGLGLFAIMSIAIAALRATLMRRRDPLTDQPHATPARLRPWVALTLISPLLLVANESIVYAGLPHRPTLTMAANVNLGPARTNHLIVPYVPAWARAEDLRVLTSNISQLRRGHHASRLLVEHLLRRHPEARLIVRGARGTEQLVGGRNATVVATASSWLVELLDLAPYQPSAARRVCSKRKP